MKIFLTILISIFIINFAFSQGEINNDNKIYYRSERGWGISAQTTGYGFNYRYAKVVNRRNKWIYQADFNTIKHDKKVKRFVIMTPTLERFVYGKLYSAFNLQLTFGRQKEIYQKLDRNSISIRIFFLIGGSTAFLKPIYYKIGESSTELEIRKFTKATPSHYIYGKASYFKGIEETKLIPGGIARVGMSFEFSKKDTRFRMLEIGAQLEVYPRVLKIMATEDNDMFYPAAFLSYRFGKVFSTHHL